MRPLLVNAKDPENRRLRTSGQGESIRSDESGAKKARIQ